MPNGTSRAPQTWDISENAMTGSHSTILTSDLATKNTVSRSMSPGLPVISRKTRMLLANAKNQLNKLQADKATQAYWPLPLLPLQQ